MNTKVTATIAVAVVALMVFAAAGATTYSWFSDEESTTIDVTTAKVEILVGWDVETDNDLDGDGSTASISTSVLNGLAPGLSEGHTYTIKSLSTINVVVKTYAKLVVVNSSDEFAEGTQSPVYVEFDGVKVYLSTGKEVPVSNWETMVTTKGGISEKYGVNLGMDTTGSDEDDNKWAGNGYEVTIKTVAYQYNAKVDLDPVNPKEDVLEINTLGDLRIYGNAVTSGINFTGKTVRLMEDINMGGIDWTPIGDSSSDCIGTFDGNGNVISNFNVKQSKHAGLFGHVQGTINGLEVSDVKISANDYAGAVVGAIYGNIYECSAKNVEIIVKPYLLSDGKTYDGGAKAGGIVGYFSEGKYVIDSCSVDNVSIIGYRDLGGVVGMLQKDTTENGCTASDVEIGYLQYTPYNKGTENENAGAIVGRIDSDATVSFSGTENGMFRGIEFVDNSDAMIEALEGGYSVVLQGDTKIDPAGLSNAYGTTGINVKNGQTIDGNGYTLDIKGAGGTWDSGINTTGGVIKNITVTGSFRGIFINHNSTHSERVVLENITIDGTTYTISCDQGMNQGLTATGSTFNGWTSFAATLGDAKFIDCKFGEGNGYSYCRPYAPTEFVGCDFEAGFEMDCRAAVTFENCTIGGVALTEDNLGTLVTGNIRNATVK